MLHSHRRRDGGPSAHSKAAALLFAVLPLQSAIMARYSQFCALARAAEILGERWTLLIGPKRFTDLLSRLHGISTSVLTERLSRLEEAGLTRRAYLEPPAASTVYELTEHGRALEPAVLQLIRWGARFLLPARPDDHREPDWLRLALAAYAATTPTPARTYRLRVRDGGSEASIRVAGGPDGTSVTPDTAPAGVSIVADMETTLSLMSGRLDVREAVRTGVIQVEGDQDILAEFPALFENTTGEEEPVAR